MVKKTQTPRYKKNPDAPRRFKSAYMFFSSEKHGEIRRRLQGEGEKLSTPAIAKLVAQAWKNLDPQQKSLFEDKARKDKARYNVEKEMYGGTWKVLAAKKEKDPNAPKRPMSAFLSFSNQRRAHVVKMHPKLNAAGVSRMLARMWKDAPDMERKDHIDKEFKLRQIYKTKMATFKSLEQERSDFSRKQREAQAEQIAEATSGDIASPNNDMPFAESNYGGMGGIVPADESRAMKVAPGRSTMAPSIPLLLDDTSGNVTAMFPSRIHSVRAPFSSSPLPKSPPTIRNFQQGTRCAFANEIDRIDPPLDFGSFSPFPRLASRPMASPQRRNYAAQMMNAEILDYDDHTRCEPNRSPAKERFAERSPFCVADEVDDRFDVMPYHYPIQARPLARRMPSYGSPFPSPNRFGGPPLGGLSPYRPTYHAAI